MLYINEWANKLKDKVAVVTGSGQGLVEPIAMAMAEEGEQYRRVYGYSENLALNTGLHISLKS